VEDCLKRIYFYRNRFRRRLRNRFSKPPQDLDLLQKKKRFDKGSDNSSNLFCCVRTCESLKRREPLPIVVAEGSFKYVGLIVEARFRGVHGSERISIGRLQSFFCGCKKHWDSIKQTWSKEVWCSSGRAPPLYNLWSSGHSILTRSVLQSTEIIDPFRNEHNIKSP